VMQKAMATSRMPTCYIVAQHKPSGELNAQITAEKVERSPHEALVNATVHLSCQHVSDESYGGGASACKPVRGAAIG